MKLILICLLALSALVPEYQYSTEDVTHLLRNASAQAKTVICLFPAFAVPSGSLKTRAIERKKPLVGIYGTQLAHIQKYPYTVSTYSDYYGMISGSGTILNHNWIITTSTQLHNRPTEDITIRGGSDDGQTGGQSSKIAKVIKNYTGDWTEDIALLKTKTKLVFNKKLKPVKLAKNLPKEGSSAALSGFGSNEIRSGVLSAGQFKISSYSACKSHYSSDTIICSESEKYSPAFDDLGDPFVQKKQLVGFYNGHGESGPFTFMAIAKFRNWIIETIKGNSEGDESDGIDDDVDFDAEENEDDEDDDDEEENNNGEENNSDESDSDESDSDESDSDESDSDESDSDESDSDESDSDESGSDESYSDSDE